MTLTLFGTIAKKLGKFNYNPSGFVKNLNKKYTEKVSLYIILRSTLIFTFILFIFCSIIYSNIYLIKYIFVHHAFFNFYFWHLYNNLFSVVFNHVVSINSDWNVLIDVVAYETRICYQLVWIYSKINLVKYILILYPVDNFYFGTCTIPCF